MKILHITASYKPAYVYGGPIYSVAALCETLVDNNFHVEVFTTTANGKLDLAEGASIINGVKVTYFKRLTKDHSHFSPSLLIKLWRTCRTYNAVHVHGWWNFVSVLSVVILMFRGVTPILSLRGMLGSYTLNSSIKQVFHWLLGRKLLQRCNLHATTRMEALEVSEAIRSRSHEVVINDWMEGCEKKVARALAINVIHNILKLPENLPVRTRKFDGSLRLIYLSRIHPKKGLEMLFEALSKVNFSYSLTVVGTGDEPYLRSLKQLAKKYEVNVNWLGAVYGTAKYTLLAEHDYLVLLSQNENFANVVIESLAVGTPVVLSDQVGLSEFVQKKSFGLVSPLNVTTINETLRVAFKLVGSINQLKFELPDEAFLLEKYKSLYNG